MMRQMREATKPIMLFTAAAFVALMVFQWGMDVTGRSSGSRGEIGKVNGTPITYNDYMSTYRNLYNQAQKSQESPITDEQNKQLEDAAFNQEVNQVLIHQELKRRGITVTNQEIEQAAKYEPPPDLRQQFTDSSGHFDLKAWQTALSEAPQDQLLLLESYYRDVIPRGKLLRQVSSGIFPSDAQLWNSWKDQHEQVEIRYVPFDPATRYPDDSVPVSDAEIQAYYQAHQDSFKVPAKASIKAVVLSKTPTPADTAAARKKAEDILQQLRHGADFATLAKKESSDSASAVRGGELGVVHKGQAVGPFDSAMFAAPVGRVVGPVETGYGFHVMEVEKRWGRDSADVRHILVPIVRTDSSEMNLLNEADSLETLGGKMSLDRAASALGLHVETATLTSTFPFLQGAGQVGEGSDWVFNTASPGDVSQVFENKQAFYELELESRSPAGILPLAEARSTIVSRLRFQKKMALAQAEAKKVVDKVAAGEPLVKVASAMKLQVRHAGPFSRDDYVPGIGRENKAIGAAFGLEPGQVSGVISTKSNVFVIEDVNRIPADSTAWVDQKAQQRKTYITNEQQQRLQEWIKALRASATIVDNRDKVLHPVGDTTNAKPEAPQPGMPGA